MNASIVLKILVLLLTGFNYISIFPVVPISEKADEHRWGSTEVEDGFTIVYDSNLLDLPTLEKERYVFQRSCNFTHSSGINKKIGLEYIGLSNNIHPGLSIEDIIFPFHSFL